MNFQHSEKQLLKALRKQEGENNIAFFASYYFSHYCNKKFSKLHFHLFIKFKNLVDSPTGKRAVEAAPRGNAKSSIISLICTIWCIVYGKKNFVILLSDTSTQADLLLASIRGELENNDRLKEDFGDMKGPVWNNNEIITSSNRKIVALGARKKIRGLRHNQYRPDLIIGDDLENDENTQNPEQRRKNESWWFKAVSKAGSENTDIFVVGTIIHYDSLLSKLLSNPLYQAKKWQSVQKFSQSTLWQQWEEIYLRMTEDEKEREINPAYEFFLSRESEMMQGVQVLWPDGQSYYRLMEIRLTEGPASFNSEYQNEPIDPSDCLFQEEWFKFIDPTPSDYTEIVGACDPSLGKTSQSNYSAIIFLGKHKDGFLDVLSADIARRHPDKIIDDILNNAVSIHQIYAGKGIPITSFGVETVQFQEYFKDKLAEESNKRSVYLPVQATENQNTKKSLRIQTLQPLVKNGTIRFQKNQRILLEQLKYYTPEGRLYDHDDGPDCLEMAVRKARAPQIFSKSY